MSKYWKVEIRLLCNKKANRSGLAYRERGWNCFSFISVRQVFVQNLEKDLIP
jgi:hypothetical protein